MNIALYFLIFVITLAIIVFAINKIWKSNLSENKGINLFIIIFILTTVVTFFGVSISRRLLKQTKNIMPTVGEKGNRGNRGLQGGNATQCKCNNDTYYNKVMDHITLVYNEWNRINGFPTIPINKYIKNKYLKNKINMICNSEIFINLVKQNGTSKYPYVNFKKGILNENIKNTCNIETNCGAFDLLLETCRKWILIILKYDKGKYFLDSEELTDRDFDTLITDLDKNQSALPGFSDDNIRWIFDNPIIFPNPGINYNNEELRKKYLIRNSDGSKTFNDDLFEKDNLSLDDISDNVRFGKIDSEKRNAFYNSDFYKFYSVNGVVSVKGKNTKSPFDEIKMFDVWYWGSSEDTKPKLQQSCDTVYDDPQRKYKNITWDLVDSTTNKTIKPSEGALESNELSQWGTSNFDIFYKKFNSVRVTPGKEYKLISGNSFDINERWYGTKLEIKDGESSSLLKLGFTHTDPLIFNSDRIRIRLKPDFEFYDQDTPKIKLKITNDYNEIWNNQNKRQIKLTSPQNISGTSLCKYKSVYVPYRNKGNVIKDNGEMETDNRKINIIRAKEFSDKNEKELKYKYYSPIGDNVFEDTRFNLKSGSEDCRPFIEANTKKPIDYKKNGPRNPTLLVSGDVVKPKEYKRKYIRRRTEGLHKNDHSYSFWEPVPPDDNYICLGDVVSSSVVGKPPSTDAVRCLPKKCLEEITDPAIIKHKWTTKDYNTDVSVQMIRNIDKEAYNALNGDGWRCGVEPSVSGFIPDTDYYFNIDNLGQQEESANNNKNIDLYTNKSNPDLSNIGKDYDFSVDSENLLSKYNVFKSRGTDELRNDIEKYNLSTGNKIVTYLESDNKVTLSIDTNENNSINLVPIDNKFKLFFIDSNENRKFIKGAINPYLVDNENEATQFTKKQLDNNTLILNTKIGGLKKNLSFGYVNIKIDGDPIDFEFTNKAFGVHGVFTKIKTTVDNIVYYLYENTSSEIKLTTSLEQAQTFYVELSFIRRSNQMKITILKGNKKKYLYIDDNNLKTSNILDTINSRQFNYTGSLTNIFRLSQIGYTTNYEDKFTFKKSIDYTSLQEDKPKFYRIKKECLYNPKEFKYKKPEIKVGEKYGKEYSVLKIYD